LHASIPSPCTIKSRPTTAFQRQERKFSGRRLPPRNGQVGRHGHCGEGHVAQRNASGEIINRLNSILAERCQYWFRGTGNVLELIIDAKRSPLKVVVSLTASPHPTQEGDLEFGGSDATPGESLGEGVDLIVESSGRRGDAEEAVPPEARIGCWAMVTWLWEPLPAALSGPKTQIRTYCVAAYRDAFERAAADAPQPEQRFHFETLFPIFSAPALVPLIAFARLWRKILELIRSSFPFF
jgi:hypothetical protein